MPSVTDSTQQENETFPQQNFTPKPVGPLKTILLGVVGLVFVSAIAFAGFWYGKNSQTSVSSEKEATPSTEAVKEELPAVVDETAGWKTYVSSAHNFSVKYPPTWIATEGNGHFPSIPASMATMINFQSKLGVFDMSIIPWQNNLKKDLSEELSSFINGYLGDFDVSYENVEVAGITAVRGIYSQGISGSDTSVILTAVERGDFVFFFLTICNTSEAYCTFSYNQSLSTFKFL